MKNEKLENYLNKMWIDYCNMNPQAHEIAQLFKSKGETIVNDHIALRTIQHPRLGIQSLSQHFTSYGYYEAGEYFFKEKKLYAKHYENKNPDYPKIFISELEISKTSDFVQKVMNEIVDQIPSSVIDNENFVYAGKQWNTSYQTYQKLAEESEYASWVYAFGFRPNHFTVSINHLKNFPMITDVNQLIKSQGYKMNTSGGEIKGTEAELLEQSSTMANEVEVKFTDGQYKIPACYYEFAKRYKMQNGELYQGFIAKSADKIFESTNRA